MSSSSPFFVNGIATVPEAYTSSKQTSLAVSRDTLLLLVAAALDDKVATVTSVTDTARNKWSRAVASSPFLGGHWLEIWAAESKHTSSITLTAIWSTAVWGELILAEYSGVLKRMPIGNVASVLCTGCSGETLTINAASVNSLLVGAAYLDNCDTGFFTACNTAAIIAPGPGQLQRLYMNNCSPTNPGLNYDLEEKTPLAGPNSLSYTTPIPPTCGLAGGGRTLAAVELLPA